ncbi:IS110 family transposase [Aneurinibacillus aneurinilyticus]|nr:IS110 family transposase [Aneurinibacillus aneurinilyticus]MED0709697.1 IS110 family transposase [Aneurinibacillus aneurinilyticus]MED0726457.1 IS110 family transposase [Aneurinibacillus aneurinilyticus]MED0734929.1 IS110 family transposase [Aneurinibacillus aneurinilyticus]MED0741833.1 IS110 family transposase [Aneurinibacillus aneurinilyticus]
MEPVIGLDVAKGVSVFQAFMKRNEACGKPEAIRHTEDGFERLGDVIRLLEQQTGKQPVVILEATGHYHRIVVAHLERTGVTYFIVNPLLSKRAKSAQLRKVKTDAADAWHLAEMYYRGDVQPHRRWEDNITEIQHLTRQHEFMTSQFVQSKLNARALLDQVCPEYEAVFSDLFSKTALQVLRLMLRGNVVTEELIRETAGTSHGRAWIQEKVGRIHALPEFNKSSAAQKVALLCIVEIMLVQQEQLSQLEMKIEEEATGIPEVGLLKTIPGIGDKLAATLIAEIGNASQFRDPKQLVAYAGLDPGVHSSGQFVATSTRITKRGSKRLRRALYLAVQCGIRRCTNERLKAYYDKKRQEGKPYKVTVIACANKLLHHIYAILKKGQPFQV